MTALAALYLQFSLPLSFFEISFNSVGKKVSNWQISEAPLSRPNEAAIVSCSRVGN
jgi:hypothetical protein